MLCGWVKNHRKMTEWEWYKKPFMYHLFSHLILIANHEDGCWQGIEIKRGQLITGRNSLKNQTGIAEQSIRTCLIRLEVSGEITRKSTNKFTIITICNYNKYQSDQPASQPAINQQSTSNQPAANHKQECKEGKECKNEKTTTTAGQKKPALFSSTDIISLGVSEEVANDFILLRKAKRAPLTKTAWNGLVKEFEKAGVDISSGLSMMMQRGWVGVKAEWLKNEISTPQSRKVQQQPRPTARQAYMLEIAAMNKKLQEGKNGINADASPSGPFLINGPLS